MSEVRQAIRSLLKQRVFAVTALLTITLGIGANVAVYAVVHSVLLSPLPFHQPKALVQVWETHPEFHNLPLSVPDYLAWQKSVKSLQLAAYTFQAMDKGTLLSQGRPVAVQGTNASSSLFPLLGVKPLLGRAYSAEEEQTKKPVAVISEGLWRRKFSSDPNVIGHILRLDKTSFTIVGVLPQTKAFPVWADVWTPLSLIDPELNATRKYHPLEVVGRLKPGFSLRQAELETETVARQLAAAYPVTNGTIGAFILPLMDAITGDVQPALIAVWIAVALVLLIACVNLAHLMMMRSLRRRQEIAIRLALGASRTTAFGSFLGETLILSLAGGLLGMVVGSATLPVIRHLAQDRIPRLQDAGMDAPVVLFGIVLSLLVGLLFAVPACLQVMRSGLSETISAGNTRNSSIRRSRISPLLMSSEVALSLAVILAATMLVRSYSLTLQTSPGFQPTNVLAVSVPLGEQDWAKAYIRFQNRIVPELMAIPGVQEVAAVNSVPMSLGQTEHTRYATRFGIVGKTFASGQFPTAQIRWGTANYFHILGIPLKQGRLLNASDHNQPRYLINETLAKRFFPHSSAVGHKLLLGVVSAHPESDEIVGVVGDVREFGLNVPPEPTMYSLDTSSDMEVLVKTFGHSKPLIRSIAITLRNVNPQAAIGEVRTLNSYIDMSLSQQRFLLALIITFAGLAGLLCAVGIYGLFGYSVTRRLREFGIRAAIGARRMDLLLQVFRECLLVVVPGVLGGIVLSAGFSRFMRTLLFQISVSDSLSRMIASILVVVLCLVAVLFPALRAARVDPASVLREQ